MTGKPSSAHVPSAANLRTRCDAPDKNILHYPICVACRPVPEVMISVPDFRPWRRSFRSLYDDEDRFEHSRFDKVSISPSPLRQNVLQKLDHMKLLQLPLLALSLALFPHDIIQPQAEIKPSAARKTVVLQRVAVPETDRELGMGSQISLQTLQSRARKLLVPKSVMCSKAK